MSIISEIIKHVNKYDEILEDYPLEKGSKEHIIVLEEIFLLYNKKTKILDVSFSASARPELVGNYMILFQKTPYVNEIQLMESYFYNDKDEMVWGEDAFKELEKLQGQTILNQFVKEQSQIYALMNYKGYEC